tara:strand:+ start:1397 stop:1546 length:150 start_codon:yes stop_codon:yes gene_type:complete
MVVFEPDENSKLIQIGGLSWWEEGREILRKYKRGKKRFKDFYQKTCTKF